MEKLKANKAYLIVSGVLIFLLALFFYLIPLSLDDYNWATSFGSNLLKDFFWGYNGRYLGNLTAIVLCRSTAMRVVLMTVVTYLLAHQISSYCTGENNVFYLLCTVSLLFVSAVLGFLHPRANLFAQTVGWASGFANYVVSALLIVTYLNLANRCYNDEEYRIDKKLYPLVFVLAVCSCLFMETATIFCVGIAFAVNFYFYVFKNKRVYKEHIVYLAGTLVGAAVMFCNSAYFHIAKGDYDKASRKLGFVNIPHALEELSGRSAGKKLILLIIAAGVIGAAVMAALPLIATRVKAERLRLYSIILLIGAITVPILFANGSHNYVLSVRLYFTQYVFAVMFALKLVNLLIKKDGLKRLFYCVSALAFCAICVFFGITYTGIHRVENARNAYIAQQLEEDKNALSIEVIEYPAKYDKFVYCSDSYSYWDSFKELHGIRTDAKLVGIEYK